MKVCLATVHHNPQFIPLALLYLKAYLVEREGLAAADVDVLEFPRSAAAAAIAADIAARTPDIVGLSCYVWNITTLREVARLVKSACPTATIVLGGPEVGPVAALVLDRNPAVDVIVTSEGETPLAELVAARRGSSGFSGVKGICYRTENGPVETAEAPELRNLNELPSPHLTLMHDYDGRYISIETQRGCVFRCNFCFYNKDLSIRNRRFDLDRVRQEIAFWLQRRPGEIYLMDPVFNLNAARAKEICRFIAAHNSRRVPIHAEIWAEFVDRELAELMREANFQFLEVGLQSTDVEALTMVERRLRMQPFLDGIRHLQEAGLHFEVQLIHGLPGETAASFRRSLDFAMALDPPDLAVFPLMVLPGTELWRKAPALGLAYDPEPPYRVRSHASMDADAIAHGTRIADAAHHLSRSRAVRLLCREPNVAFSELVESWIELFAEQPGDEADGARMMRFVDTICARKGIRPQFYQAFVALEFDEPPARAS